MVLINASVLDEIQNLFIEKNTEDNSIVVVSYCDTNERAIVKEFYLGNLKRNWIKVEQFIRKLPSRYTNIRLDLVTNENKVSYDELQNILKDVPRNNYEEFGFRTSGNKKRLFIKEEIVANALFVPDDNHRVGVNNPNLDLDEHNILGYTKRKYGKRDDSISYFKKEDIYIFNTYAVYYDGNNFYELEDYGNGNQVREINEENFPNELYDVILKGTKYLDNQLLENGKFVYGYFPAYGRTLSAYNTVRHFSSLYALAESVEHFPNEKVLKDVKLGLDWGLENLVDTKEDGSIFVKEQLKDGVEYKLGAQAMIILALAKYSQISNDNFYFEKMKQFIKSIEKHFIGTDNKTIHVLKENLSIKEKFRIVYYDGEALFATLRAYELMKDEEIFEFCKKLMDSFVENHYEKYHDHWLSYAVNEFLKFEQDVEYYKFGVRNAMDNLEFIQKRDSAYPTMLELLCAANKMMDKLESFDKRDEVFATEDEYLRAKKKIRDVTDYRAFHEITSGVMLPEFAMFFKYPSVIENGFYCRHDRFRMRIDDAEHFLSGLINYLLIFKKGMI
ncbi:hypothetical protein BG261_10995 [Floricoccus tropicus]|uniref:Poly(Glycerol-phosphate) alpha-glucosyltransferase n=1 Tax=Floricoccus tropicus TaxID=1859473 RepID=A0A1E8GM71_9LACT|nr:hypothetical protein [Floricoccus tropicus]OFI49267.1 hypothetical protein BG261_10995 [Floricoccus tropicus]